MNVSYSKTVQNCNQNFCQANRQKQKVGFGHVLAEVTPEVSHSPEARQAFQLLNDLRARGQLAFEMILNPAVNKAKSVEQYNIQPQKIRFSEILELVGLKRKPVQEEPLGNRFFYTRDNNAPHDNFIVRTLNKAGVKAQIV